mgnify:CR=1 FL=1
MKDQDINLHSTVVLLKVLYYFLTLLHNYHLHSTVVLLKATSYGPAGPATS